MTQLIVRRPRTHDWLSSLTLPQQQLRLSERDFVNLPATTTLRVHDTLTSVFIKRENDGVDFEIHAITPAEKEWVHKVLDRIGGQVARLLFLPPAWDSFEGQRVSIDAAQGATQLLLEILEEATPVPAVVPGSDGSLQLEWHMPGGELEINVESHSKGLVFWRHGGAEWERELRDVRSQLQVLLHQLTTT